LSITTIHFCREIAAKVLEIKKVVRITFPKCDGVSRVTSVIVVTFLRMRSDGNVDWALETWIRSNFNVAWAS
jgi:hypothetical protein